MEEKIKKDKKIKKLSLDQNISNKIHLFFNGDIDNINLTKLQTIYKDPKISKSEFKLTVDDIKKLKQIIKKSKDPKVRIIVLKPNIDLDVFDSEEKSEKKELIEFNDIETKDINTFIDNSRKAYIDWVNNTFYPMVIKDRDDKLKIYQNFVKKYLTLDTPYRGLLVYHGLGTGKTATAISSAEGFSNQMNITTLLPASLETEFINEIRKWGNNFFKIDMNNWIFYTKEQILENPDIKEILFNTFKINIEDIDTIYNKVRRKDKSFQKGLWLNDYNKENISKIKSVSGYYIDENGENKEKLKKEQILSDNEMFFIDTQINHLITLKYNFIHYNPFPKVKETKMTEFLYKDGDDEEFNKYSEEKKRYTQNIINKLQEKLVKNQKELNINSPFYNEIIIIDEVHNFIRQILNDKSGTASIFYNWIMEAKDIKLIFLSGTPIINKPSEISYLFNMLKGKQKIYNFTINEKIPDLDLLNENLKEIFYKNNSPIQQFIINQKKGKIIISFLQNSSNFQSILNPDDNIVYTIKYNDHSFDDFINSIFKGLNSVFTPDLIKPSLKEIKDLDDKKLLSILKGKETIFDTDANIIFNQFTNLFTVFENDRTIDLNNNDSFMEYFFNDDGSYIPVNKKTLLKRMISGLVSYYPIDRSAITTMPQIIKPNNTIYNNYNISENINIIDCPMSFKQFEIYTINYQNQKEKSIKRNKKTIFSDSNFDYNIRTRQTCNIVYENDNFRKISNKNPDYKIKKEEEYQKLSDYGGLNDNLIFYSPKFFKIIQNINKFVEDDTPTGKILFYSEFRGDSGSEIFEKILIANGYEKFNPDTYDNTPKKRYTFITGKENKNERKLSREAYNNTDNIYGQNIQIMIISGAGAEGISLHCVRQVHILEPYWNFIRIDQVFGRAIRLKSHTGKDLKNPWLPKDKQNVEQYIYVSTFPKGNDILSVYKNLLEMDNWTDLPQIDLPDNEITNNLISNHKSLYSTIQKIIKIKSETKGNTADQILFDIMEKKYNISNEILNIIKEASVDCIQNTRDNPILNENCIRYNDLLKTENSYFPGISSEELNNIDNKQLQAKNSFFIKPNILVVSGEENQLPVYVYYLINDKKYINDIRYIKENSTILGKIIPKFSLLFLFSNKNDLLNSKLGSKFSVFQEIYKLDTYVTNDIKNDIFYNINTLTIKENLIGYKIKYNVNETFYFYPNTPIIRLYPYDILFDKEFDITGITPIILNKSKIYKNS